MNIRFDPVSILDVSTIKYCSFCSTASVTDLVHSNNRCILDELNLISSTNDQTVLINFEFYQCFLKNCSFTSNESLVFQEHLSDHGICLDIEKVSQYHYHCQYCPYKTLQKQYFDSHQDICEGQQAESSSASASRSSFGSKRKRMDPSDSQNVTTKSSSLSTLGSATRVCDEKISTTTLASTDEVITILECSKKTSVSLSENVENSDKPQIFKYRCSHCSYSTYQQRFYASHEKLCQGMKNRYVSSIASESQPIPMPLSSNKLINEPAASKDRMSIEISDVSNQISDEDSPNRSDHNNENYHNNSLAYSTAIHGPQKSDSEVHNQSHLTLLDNKTDEIDTADLEDFQSTYSPDINVATTTADKTEVVNCVGLVHYKSCSSLSEPLQLNSWTKPTSKVANVFACSKCDFKAINNIHFKYHVKNCSQTILSTLKHKNVKVILKKTIASKRKKIVKSTNVRKERHFSCTNCSYKTNQSRLLKFHLNLCGTNGGYICENCFYICRRKDSMQRHLAKMRCHNLNQIDIALEEKPHKPKENQILQINNAQAFAVQLKCALCPFSARLSIRVKHHQRKCSSGLYEDYRCKTCHDVFTSRELFIDHMKKHTYQDKSYLCDNCPYQARSQKEIGDHKLLCHQKDITIFRCVTCNFLTPWKHYYNRHIKNCEDSSNKQPTNLSVKSHLIPKVTPYISESNNSAIKKNILKCPKCPFLSSNNKSYSAHTDICKNDSIVTYRCTICNAVSRRLAYIKGLHYKMYHKSVKPIIMTENITNKTDYSRNARANQLKALAIKRNVNKIKCEKESLEDYNKTNATVNSSDKIERIIPTTSLINKSNKPRKMCLKKCPYCPYKIKWHNQMKIHKKLCFEKTWLVKSSDETLSCAVNGCFFLSRSISGMKIHTKRHRIALTNSHDDFKKDGAVKSTESSSCPDYLPLIKAKSYTDVRMCNVCHQRFPSSNTAEIGHLTKFCCRKNFFDSILMPPNQSLCESTRSQSYSYIPSIDSSEISTKPGIGEGHSVKPLPFPTIQPSNFETYNEEISPKNVSANATSENIPLLLIPIAKDAVYKEQELVTRQCTQELQPGRTTDYHKTINSTEDDISDQTEIQKEYSDVQYTIDNRTNNPPDTSEWTEMQSEHSADKKRSVDYGTEEQLDTFDQIEMQKDPSDNMLSLQPSDGLDSEENDMVSLAEMNELSLCLDSEYFL